MAISHPNIALISGQLVESPLVQGEHTAMAGPRSIASPDDEVASPILQIKPREVAGRDTIARFNAQFRATALACIQILSQTVDRVYCDYQDDFVSMTQVNGAATYRFYQVKTSGTRNHQWSRLQVFGVPRRLSKKEKKPSDEKAKKATGQTPQERIAASFAGKLLDHTNRFGDSCTSVSLLTNASLDDDLEDLLKTLSDGTLAHDAIAHVIAHFNETYALDPPLCQREIEVRVRKLTIEPNLSHLSPHDKDFSSKATQAIHEFSEIDLTVSEGAAIIDSLIKLVERKCHSKLMESMTEADLNAAAGIGIEEMLSILSISKGAYDHLLAGGDSQALKSASLFQRKLAQAGAPSEMIETAIRWKVEWDNWLRTHRHHRESSVNFLLNDLREVHRKWVQSVIPFRSVLDEVRGLHGSMNDAALQAILTEEILLGGVFAELVRSEAR